MKTLEQINQDIQCLEEKLKNVKGKETEVYTRIVGYHRAVDNWNNGKREEYKKRVTFSINGDKWEKVEKMLNNPSKQIEKKELSDSSIEYEFEQIASYRLFTSQFCRNCSPVKNFIQQLSIKGEEIDVSTDLGMSISSQYGIMSTPTVIFFDKKDNELGKVYSVNELKKILKKEQALA